MHGRHLWGVQVPVLSSWCRLEWDMFSAALHAWGVAHDAYHAAVMEAIEVCSHVCQCNISHYRYYEAGTVECQAFFVKACDSMMFMTRM